MSALDVETLIIILSLLGTAFVCGVLVALFCIWRAYLRDRRMLLRNRLVIVSPWDDDFIPIERRQEDIRILTRRQDTYSPKIIPSNQHGQNLAREDQFDLPASYGDPPKKEEILGHLVLAPQDQALLVSRSSSSLICANTENLSATTSHQPISDCQIEGSSQFSEEVSGEKNTFDSAGSNHMEELSREMRVILPPLPRYFIGNLESENLSSPRDIDDAHWRNRVTNEERSQLDRHLEASDLNSYSYLHDHNGHHSEDLSPLTDHLLQSTNENAVETSRSTNSICANSEPRGKSRKQEQKKIRNKIVAEEEATRASIRCDSIAIPLNPDNGESASSPAPAEIDPLPLPSYCHAPPSAENEEEGGRSQPETLDQLVSLPATTTSAVREGSVSRHGHSDRLSRFLARERRHISRRHSAREHADGDRRRQRQRISRHHSFAHPPQGPPPSYDGTFPLTTLPPPSALLVLDGSEPPPPYE